jgi:hypothetical protein
MNIVDATFELVTLPEVVYPDEKGFAPAGTVGVTESVIGRGSVAEVLGGRWGAWRETGSGMRA